MCFQRTPGCSAGELRAGAEARSLSGSVPRLTFRVHGGPAALRCHRPRGLQDKPEKLERMEVARQEWDAVTEDEGPYWNTDVKMPKRFPRREVR